jgi:predicted alpha/beta hydrolase family esterase
MDPDRVSPHLIVPGWGGSSAEHWQSLWQPVLGAARVELNDWLSVQRDAWIAALDSALAELAQRDPRPPVLIAHSLGCIAIVHWSRIFRRPIRAALLVAPADVECAASLQALRSFAPIPLAPLPFSSVVVSSDDDPHITPPRAELLATQWGSRLELIAGGGHLNAASQLGSWAKGRELLAAVNASR